MPLLKKRSLPLINSYPMKFWLPLGGWLGEPYPSIDHGKKTDLVAADDSKLIVHLI